MKYLYGPVKSRRIGSSLGISLTPYKTCSFNCLYCQLGKTNALIVERKEYIDPKEILEELRLWLENNPEEANILDYITLAGSGEPTLNIKLSEIIDSIRKITNHKIALITNSSLLSSQDIRREILGVDLIIPSLDAVTQEVLIKVDNPFLGIKVEDIIDGLILLRKEFKGKIWLEVMLLKGINDDIRHIKKLKEVIEQINPDKVQINSPVRMPIGANVSAVSKSKLVKIKNILGEKAEIV